MIETLLEVDGAELAISRTPGRTLEVIALHGAEPGTRSSSPLYVHLHRVLPTVGVGVVTFDRRGEGQSTGTPSRGDFEQQVADCIAIIDSLDGEAVGLWGFSQGGWIAPLVAARRADVACVVTVASCGVTPFEQMRYGVARHLRDEGYDDEVVRRVDALRVMWQDALYGRQPSVDTIDERLREAAAEPWWPHAYLPDQLHDRDRDATIAEMGHDPRPSFEAVRCPVLAFYGEDDEWTPVEPSVAAWHATQGAQVGNVTTVVLHGARHSPLDGDQSSAEEYERRLVTWLSGVTATRGGFPPRGDQQESSGRSRDEGGRPLRGGGGGHEWPN